jgi:MFS family permease
MNKLNNPSALRFVVLLGVVSLFADVTYEAARSISGPYLALLGASAAAVGVIAGLGELIGYGLRIISGLISDRTQRYWTITIVGYAVNLLAEPALALAGYWWLAAILMMTERLGKAIRTPARDAMLSHAARGLGAGWAFGLHEALDQVGAMLGPVIVAVILAGKGSYQYGFAVLAIPAGLALAVLGVARFTYPQPRDLEPSFSPRQGQALPAPFWWYLGAVALLAMGFTDFALAAFHLKTTHLADDKWIPLIYAGAMGIDAVSALLLGRLYDKKGVAALMIAVALSAASAPLIFLAGIGPLLAGMVLWAVGLGAQESIVRAVVADIVPCDRRASGFGIFNAGFGLAWFGGSALMGLLYTRSLPALAAFSAVSQLASIPVLFLLKRRCACPSNDQF